MNVVLVLTTNFNTHVQKFYQLVNDNICNCVIVIDTNEDYSQYTSLETYQVSDKECIENGFFNSFAGSVIPKNPIAWDKAIYYLSKTNFEKAIIIEEDCLVLNPKIFLKFFKAEFDLLSPQHSKRIGKSLDWHWRSIEQAIAPPHFYSMVCCIGVSKKLIDKVVEHKNKIGSLFYAESMFSTIAEQNNLIVKTPKELSSIVAMGNWNQSFFKIFKNNIFHPVKNIEKHNFYRFFNLTTLKTCFQIPVNQICPLPHQNLLIPKFLKR